MDNRMITPWDMEPEALTNEFYVPEYIEQMAVDVLKQYDFSVDSMFCVTTKSDKGGSIWKIETNQGPKSIKLLHRRPTRSLFSLGAQEYLVEVQKARVPPLVKTRNGINYVEAGGKLWFVAEWIEELAPVTKDLAGAKQLCYGLGEFHRLTRGYIPPRQAEMASRIHKWPKTYHKVVNKMDWFRNLARAYHDMPASAPLFEIVDYFEQQAITSFRRLADSRYNDLINLGKENWGLAHQDYGWSNGQMGPGGLWIIDLDGVAFDLPIRDLSKLISGTMADLMMWDAEWIRGMIEAYHEANPISPELYEVLMIDLSLPTDFYKNIKEIVYEPELFLNEETAAMIQRIIETDHSKLPILQEVEKDWEGKSAPILKNIPVRDDQDELKLAEISRWALLSSDSEPVVTQNAYLNQSPSSSLETSQWLDQFDHGEESDKKKKDKEKKKKDKKKVKSSLLSEAEEKSKDKKKKKKDKKKEKANLLSEAEEKSKDKKKKKKDKKKEKANLLGDLDEMSKDKKKKKKDKKKEKTNVLSETDQEKKDKKKQKKKEKKQKKKDEKRERSERD